MVQKSQKWPKTQIKGGGPALIWFLFRYLLSTCCTFTRVVRVCAPLLGPLHGRNSCYLWVWQVVSVFHCGLPHQISPLPPTPSQTDVCSTMGESIRLSSIHNPTLRRTNLPLLAIGRRANCSGERRTSPFNGIERSLSRAVVIKTKSLPVSATTFPTALSLYIAHDGRKHKHNPKLSANKHVV